MKNITEYNFDYFYNKEANFHTYYLVPKVLFSEPIFKNLSIDSKMLYSILLDRAKLSFKNKWIDEKKRVYLYFSIEEIMSELQCATQKACQLMKRLTEFGLVEKKKQGQGKPDMIYIKSCFKYLK